MKVGIGFSDNSNSIIAGRQAANIALSKVDKKEVCDLVLLFSTAAHDPKILKEAVVDVTGNKDAIFGGGAVGIITNDAFGYAGSQVGVACIWLEDSSYNSVVASGLLESETQTGERLGAELLNKGIDPDTPIMMFYDAVNRTENGVSLLMATWLLEGLGKSLGFSPNLVGAGMQGDHMCNTIPSYLGDKEDQHSVFALSFSDDIALDNVIMHGCRPASDYFTVTKSEGPVILEINNEPAIDFIDNLIGPNITPEQYPFFLIFGINHGEKDAPYDENNYASRLCLGVDLERKGIVMFEPDMVPGTQFQLMFRSLEMDYMQPKLKELEEKIGDKEPIFALYIDCAGRCAGYGGVEMEDAVVIQKALGNKVPLLGLYTGVEIAEIGGRPRGLDWTGVLCVFSKKTNDNKNEKQKVIWENSLKNDKDELSKDALSELVNQNSKKVLELDTLSIKLRHELEQKRRGFKLLSELAVSLNNEETNTDMFDFTARRINSALNMQRTIVLLPDTENKNIFVPVMMQGYSEEEKKEISVKRLELDERLLDQNNAVIVNGASAQSEFASFRKDIKLPYFISTTIDVYGDIAGIIITGRTMEATPFLSRLEKNDAETLQAIAALLATVLVYEKLDDVTRIANTDGLTGLLNRNTLESRVNEVLKNTTYEKTVYALMVIDFDFFKEINDNYGHMVGDKVLIDLASTLKNSFRSSDFVGRIGGDEFVVFASFKSTMEDINERLEGMMNRWRGTVFQDEKGKEFSCTLSVGVALAPYNGITYTELFKNADKALYDAKENGRNQFVLY